MQDPLWLKMYLLDKETGTDKYKPVCDVPNILKIEKLINAWKYNGRLYVPSEE